MEVINNDTFMKFKMNPLNKFIDGNIAFNYINEEERGFPIQGTISPILNLDKNDNLKDIKDGLIINPVLRTIDPNYNNRGSVFNTENNIGINQPNSTDLNFINSNMKIPPTPILEQNTISELLPKFSNGIVNKTLSPDNKTFKLNNSGSPLLYGVSTFGVNNPELLTNPRNNIGHEIHQCGKANSNGIRALSQGKSANSEMMPGTNVPPLKTRKNNNGAFISEPVTFNDNINLYQVGNWTKIPGNFLYNFDNSQVN